MPNTLYYGDNLQVLRDHIPDESVDLVYLDPPFNSNASYNVLFREKSGEDSPAQIKAFTDTWEWTVGTERTFEQDIILHPGTPSAVKDMIAAFRQFIGQNAMMAYLVMMTPRLVELRRVLKPTGSLYLHCDPTASHYLKLLLVGRCRIMILCLGKKISPTKLLGLGRCRTMMRIDSGEAHRGFHSSLHSFPSGSLQFSIPPSERIKCKGPLPGR